MWDNTSGSVTYEVTPGGSTVDYSPVGGGVPVNGIEAIVIDSLSQTGRFRLVERTELGSVLDEQDLAASGRVAAPSGAATGSVLGAEYLVQVVVTDYEANTSGKDAGVGGLFRKVPLVGGIKGGMSEGRVGLNIRLIDATTSEITFTKTDRSDHQGDQPVVRRRRLDGRCAARRLSCPAMRRPPSARP